MSIRINLSDASVASLPTKKQSSKKKKDPDLAKRIHEVLDRKYPSASKPKKEKRISMIEFIKAELQAKDKYEKRGRVLKSVVETAQKLPKLSTPIKGLNCYTTYTEGHPALIQKHFNPLMSPPQSVAPLLTPLRSLAKQLPDTDPEFTLFISSKQAETANGNCSYAKKRIHLHNNPSKPSSTTLLHELSHLAIDKLGWKKEDQRSLRKSIKEEAAKDIAALSAKGWQGCSRIVANRLSGVSGHYAPKKHWDEYMVRTSQIISETAQAYPRESSDQIEARIKRDIPHLFAVYKSSFVPQLRAYVAKNSRVCTSKRQPDAAKVIEELSSVFQRRRQPEPLSPVSGQSGLSTRIPQPEPLRSVTEVIKDSQVVGLTLDVS